MNRRRDKHRKPSHFLLVLIYHLCTVHTRVWEVSLYRKSWNMTNLF